MHCFDFEIRIKWWSTGPPPIDSLFPIWCTQSSTTNTTKKQCCHFAPTFWSKPPQLQTKPFYVTSHQPTEIPSITINFSNVHDYNYPIFKYFKLIDKTNPCNLIKFNVGNEYAVDLFKQKKIKYIEIFDLIKEITSLNIDSDVNNIDNIIQYHEKLNQHIKFLF